MKKLFLVFPVIALLATSCNNSQQANLTPTNNQSNYCIGSIPTEIGGVVYPIDPKYGNLDELGQIFTANDCGPTRLSEITGNGKDYDLGSSLTLKLNPPANFITVLQSIGYTCANGGTATSCKQWRLTKTVKLNEILQLQPYSEMIERDDCINCG